jgi:hypothetical protein
VNRRPFWVLVAVALALVGAVLNNQLRVHRGRQWRVAKIQAREAMLLQRQRLFDMLRPVALSNCQLERFGEAHDGGYLMCANLLDKVRSGYSYGISGYDKWGCDISTRLNLTVHQYDCFDTTAPACPAGRTVFHAECVGDAKQTTDGRTFDTIENQLASNGDRSTRIVLKIDVEGAEWASFLALPDDVLEHIDQMSVEFHWLRDEQLQWLETDRYRLVMQRLTQVFQVAHVHFNNAGCAPGLEPFPTWAYEVLFVSKRLAVVDPSRTVSGLHPLDALNNPSLPDCQPGSATGEGRGRG